MQETIKVYDRDIQFALTQTSAVLEHAYIMGHIPIWSKVKFIDCDPTGTHVGSNWLSI